MDIFPHPGILLRSGLSESGFKCSDSLCTVSSNSNAVGTIDFYFAIIITISFAINIVIRFAIEIATSIYISD